MTKLDMQIIQKITDLSVDYALIAAENKQLKERVAFLENLVENLIKSDLVFEE